jgi:putative endonuclease
MLLYAFADRLRHIARRRRWPADQATGRFGEDLAHRLLRRQGYRVVARNWRPRSGAGEVDLVAWDGPVLVFVEVKTRGTEEFGTPDRAIDSEKQATLARAAREYTRRAGVAWERVRFDVVSVLLGKPPRLELRRDAFRDGQTL